MLLNAEDRPNGNRWFPPVMPVEWPDDLKRFVFNRIDEREENIGRDDVLNIAEWLFYDHLDHMPATWIEHVELFIAGDCE